MTAVLAAAPVMVLAGTAGAQTPTCQGRSATIVGTAGNDALVGTAGQDVIVALAGNDHVMAYGGDDFVCLGPGNDIVESGEGHDRSFGDAGGDALYGDAGVDTLSGGADGDVLYGGRDGDWLYGEQGNDYAIADSVVDGQDRFWGGPDVDTALYHWRTNRVEVSLDALADDGEAGEADYNDVDVENVWGGRGSDKIIGSASVNELNGGLGEDVIDGKDGNDTIDGGPGNDSLWGSDDDDTILGGTGHNILKGGPNNDTLTGGSGIDFIGGDGGNDGIAGGQGDDRIFGGPDNDTLVAEFTPDGADTFAGESGIDTVSYFFRTGSVTVRLDGLQNDGAAGEGDDIEADVEIVHGGSVSDAIVGNSLANRLHGHGGNDVLNAVDGIMANDHVDGGADLDVCTYDPGDVAVSC